MFHVKHFDPRYSDGNRETFLKKVVKHWKQGFFGKEKPQYLGFGRKKEFQ